MLGLEQQFGRVAAVLGRRSGRLDVSVEAAGRRRARQRLLCAGELVPQRQERVTVDLAKLAGISQPLRLLELGEQAGETLALRPGRAEVVGLGLRERRQLVGVALPAGQSAIGQGVVDSAIAEGRGREV